MAAVLKHTCRLQRKRNLFLIITGRMDFVSAEDEERGGSSHWGMVILILQKKEGEPFKGKPFKVLSKC